MGYMEDVGGIRFATWSWISRASMRYHKSFICNLQIPDLKNTAFPATPFFSRSLTCISGSAQPLAATRSHSQPHAATRSHTQPLAATRSHTIASEWPQVVAPENSTQVAASGHPRKFQYPTSISTRKASLYVPSEDVPSHGITQIWWGGQCVVR